MIFTFFTINLLVYAPAIFHHSRSDQDIFLAELYHVDDLKDLISYSYSYTRTRIIGEGDSILFRPLLYIFLSIEKWLYGYNFIYWQLTGLFFHFLLVWQLFKILNFIHKSSLAILLTLHFSVLHICQEMVIWHHIHAYILCAILLLKAFHHFLLYLESNQSKDSHLFRMVVFITFACFLFEFGLIFSGTMLIALLIHRKIRLNDVLGKKFNNVYTLKRSLRPLFLLFPIFCYTSWSLTDYFVRGNTLQIVNKSFSVYESLGYCCKYFWVSLVGPFLPYFFEILPGTRLFATSFDFKEVLKNYVSYDFLSNCNILLIFLIFLVIIIMIFKFFSFKRVPSSQDSRHKIEFFDRDLLFLGLTSLILSLAYIVMLTLGRALLRGEIYIQTSLYQFYVPILFMTIFIYSFIFSLKHILSKNKEMIVNLLVAVLCLSVFLNGFKNFQLNHQMARRYGIIWNFLENTEQFVEDQRKEGDFHFYFFWKYRYPEIEISVKDLILGKHSDSVKIYFLSKRYASFGFNDYRIGRLDSAIDYYSKSITINPTDFTIYTNRGVIYSDQGRFELALNDYNKALELFPRSYKVYNNRGIVYRKKGLYDLALKDYTRAIELNSDKVEAFYNRAAVYKMKNFYNLAISDLKKVLEIEPNNKGAQLRISKIYQLMESEQY